MRPNRNPFSRLRQNFHLLRIFYVFVALVDSAPKTSAFQLAYRTISRKKGTRAETVEKTYCANIFLDRLHQFHAAPSSKTPKTLPHRVIVSRLYGAQTEPTFSLDTGSCAYSDQTYGYELIRKL